jgi:signal transduction histidine kinase
MKRQVTASTPAGRDPSGTKLRRESNGHKGVPGKMPRTVGARAAVPAELRQLERLFADCTWPERRAFVRARKRARERAVDVLEGSGSGSDASRTALLVAATELFVALKMEPSASLEEAARLAQQLEEINGIPRIALAREVLRAPEFLSLSPAVAVEAQLATLIAFAPLRNVSLWTLSTAEHANCMRHVGEGSPSRGARQLAERLLAGDISEPTGPSQRRLLLGLPVGRREQPLAVLVASARLGIRDSSRHLLADAVPVLGAVLERDALLSGNAVSERALVESSERKLTRLGFDLHDGPIQDVAVLGEDLRLFRDQLELIYGPLTQHELVGGRIEDLDAQLVSLDAELRRLSSEVQAASVLLNRPFNVALGDRIQAFAARTSIDPRLTLAGDVNLLSTSQQIALLNIIQEALSNIREHANATMVAITVSVDADGVEAKVVDDGLGFDLESTLMRAARDGRIGLLAMHERVRLLGGQCRIESRPGGPTVVWVALEHWLPLLAEPRPNRVSA